MKQKAIKCVKGFNKDLKCRGFQYEVGKEYETDSIEMCTKGFHAIDETESPLSVFMYYPPCDSDGTSNRFCLVELSGKTMKEEEKTVGSKIKIVKEIGIEGVIDLQREWSETHSVDDSDSFKHDDYSLASNTGNYSVSTNTGFCSVVANTGACSSASNTGNSSASTNTGAYSSASNKGDCSTATNTGDFSSSSNTGDYSVSVNTGKCSSASNTGEWSVAGNTGYYSSASNTGDYSSASSTGDCSSAINKGNCASASNTGDESSSEVHGRESIAAVYGKDCKAKGALGCALVLTERGDWNDDIKGYPLKNILAVMVDGVNVKADTWYRLVDGNLTECK